MAPALLQTVFRLAHGMTDKHLAETLGMHRSHISRLRRGHCHPSLRFVVAAKRAFPQLNLHDLIAPVGPGDTEAEGI